MKIKNILSILMILIIGFITSASADVIPVSKNVFVDQEKVGIEIIKTAFVIVVLDNRGVGRFYYISSEKTGNSVIWSFRVAAGHSPLHETKSGIYKIYLKKKKWMSTLYPNPNGINNMDYSMYFNGSVALHQGSISNFSHGCVHMRKIDAQRLFKETKVGTPVIITRHNYNSFLSSYEKNNIFGEIAQR